MVSELIVKLNFWSIILFFASFLGIFLSFTLFTSGRGSKPGRNYLGILVFTISAMLSEFVIFSFGLYDNVKLYSFVTTPLIFLVGPVYYFFIRGFALKNKTLRFKDIIHLLPFLFLFINLIPTYYAIVLGTLPSLGYTSHSIFLIHPYTIHIIHIFQFGFYVLVSQKFLKDQQSSLKEKLSNGNIIYSVFLSRISSIFMIFLLLNFFTTIIMIATGEHSVEIEYVIFLYLAVIIFYIGYTWLAKPEIFASEYSGMQAKKYEKSGLDSESSRSYKITLLDFMTSEKPYLKPDLKQSQLAARLGISSHTLSQILNENLKTNFFDFVNSYRVAEVKINLLKPEYENFSILAIAFESGFNSKTSFNRIFKKETGTTPSQYLKENKLKSEVI